MPLQGPEADSADTDKNDPLPSSGTIHAAKPFPHPEFQTCRGQDGSPPQASKLYPTQVRSFQDSFVFTLIWELAITLHRIFFIFDEIILSFNFSYFLCILVNRWKGL